jgi:hypothetical protein
MTEAQTLAYVQASATALRLKLDAAQTQRVAVHMQRTAAMAQLLDDLHLPPELEKAQLYVPAPHQPLTTST